MIGIEILNFIRHDVSKEIKIPGPVDYVLHFASPASPVDYLNYPIQTLKVGALGSHNTLGLAKAKKARFLLASTSEVYGDPLEHPQKENYWGQCQPDRDRAGFMMRLNVSPRRSPWRIIVITRSIRGLSASLIPTAHGCALTTGASSPILFIRHLKNKSITVFGTGRQTRSFCYYCDLIEGII